MPRTCIAFWRTRPRFEHLYMLRCPCLCCHAVLHTLEAHISNPDNRLAGLFLLEEGVLLLGCEGRWLYTV
jgi:hypothetical protein